MASAFDFVHPADTEEILISVAPIFLRNGFMLASPLSAVMALGLPLRRRGAHHDQSVIGLDDSLGSET